MVREVRKEVRQLSSEIDIEEVREAANNLFEAIVADPAVISLGKAVNEAAWSLYYVLNPDEDEEEDE